MASQLEPQQLLALLGMNEAKIADTMKNAALINTLREVVVEGGLEDHDAWSKSYRSNLYEVATRFPKQAIKHRPFFMKYIAQDKIGKAQLNNCIAFFKKNMHAENISAEDFELECGIGVQITRDDVEAAVNTTLDSFSDASAAWSSYATIMSDVKRVLKFADGQLVKEVLDEVLTKRFGAKPAAGAKKPAVAKGEIKKTSTASTTSTTSSTTTTTSSSSNSGSDASNSEQAEDLEDSVLHVRFHDPKDNIQVRPELLENHLKITGGRIQTRFPPEPNGYLHLGHCKSMNLNFGYSAREGGVCYLRFDDTNPEKEEQEYIDSIINSVEWMGFKPWKITYTSDYFQELFDFAVQLIKDGKAFVCHQPSEEMQKARREKQPSPWRDRPIEESLALFYEMRDGKHEEGTISLRLKMDINSDNANMRDVVAYRIKRSPHPRTGDKWLVYPTYDYSHCIVDSLENITHSLCSLEFDSRREPYEWIIHALGIYCPRQIEFSRLNVTCHLMSKRRIIKLVKGGVLRGWDDPRLATIAGLRRRGYRPEALKDFCNRVGISRSTNFIEIALLERCVSNDLNSRAPRAMAVADPIRVVCSNFPEDNIHMLEVPNFPAEPARGSHLIPFSRVFYIDRADFRAQDDPSFFRLTPNKEVGLRHFQPPWKKESEYYTFKCTEFKTDASDATRVSEITVEIVTHTKKPKVHYIQFVAQPAAGVEPKKAELRLYNELFQVRNPSELGDDWEQKLNPNSELIVSAYVDAFAAAANVGDQFQFERNGYYTVDSDTTPENLVFNRTVSI